MRTNVAHYALLLGLLPLASGSVLANGRHGDYVTTGSSSDRPEVHPVKLGSAANPNPAFTPPKFQTNVPQLPPLSSRGSKSKPAAPASTAPASATTPASSGAPAATPAPATPPAAGAPVSAPVGSPPVTPPPYTPASPGHAVTGSDSSEPPLPDSLGAPDNAGSAVHPPAQ